MPLSSDFLEHADFLAGGNTSTASKSIDLRRSISAAYYALFHLLVEKCSESVAGTQVPGLAGRVSRAISHTDLRRRVRSNLLAQPVPELLQSLLGTPVSPQLRYITERFIKLQDARHSADYDSLSTFSRVEALERVAMARNAFTYWSEIANTDQADVFLKALAFGARWSK